MLAKLGPGKQRKAQVDGGRVQRIQTLIQIYTDRIRRIQRPRDADQHLREVGVDAPVMRVVGIGQRGARHAAVKPHVVELAAQRAQTSFYVPKAIPISQLSKGHRQILVPTRESSRSRIAAVPRHAAAKLTIRQEVQQLGENSSALVHALLSPPAETSFWALSLFKSRQAKSPYNSRHQRDLQVGKPPLAGH